MSVEEEVELKDMVTQTLELNGCLAKIRAQLRASLFLALDEDPKVNSEKPLFNDKIKSYLDIPEGQLMFCIVREFLEFFNLDFTISVYEPESYLGNHYKYEGRGKIIEDLGIKNWDNSNGPILLHLVKIAQAKSKKLEINLNINNENEIRESLSSSSKSEFINSELTKSNGIDNNNIVKNGVNNQNEDFIENGPSSLNSTYIKNSSPQEEIAQINFDKTNKSSDDSTENNDNPEQKATDKKAKGVSDLPHVSDILPSLYNNKELKERTNLKELDKLFDMEAEYEEDFMSPSDVDLSLNSKCEHSKSIKEELETSKGLSESNIKGKSDENDATDDNETSLSVDPSFNHIN